MDAIKKIIDIIGYTSKQKVTAFPSGWKGKNMENVKMNLVKQNEWYNPYIAIDEKGNCYELENINCNFIGYSIDRSFLRTNFTILDNYKIDDVIGFVKNKSNGIAYSDELKEAYKKVDSYNFQYHPEELEKAIKLIREKQKEYKKALEEEENYTLKDYKKMIKINSNTIDPYYIISTIKQTFGADIEELEAIK